MRIRDTAIFAARNLMEARLYGYEKALALVLSFGTYFSPTQKSAQSPTEISNYIFGNKDEEDFFRGDN